ncbi:imidazole glycerol phosphate synthase subunit HisH [Brevundimonas vesicularis]|uniref:imidazole glycerol phosphate synthase subunit HisH n=1 Tax=Brevundimonas vesicularis TaxID=41276 RepID=UPI0038D4DA26
MRVTADPADVLEAERVILPGVGAAGFAMQRLHSLGLVEALRRFERPLMGVCLGQQLLFEASDEDGDIGLLGLIPGRVTAIEARPSMPSPHMGWSRLTKRRDDPLLEGVSDGEWAYFVHGLVCPDSEATIAAADYGQAIPAVVNHQNRWGCQFHPERSSRTGARILRNFLELPA